MSPPLQSLQLVTVRTTLVAAETLQVLLEEMGALGTAIERKRGARLVHLLAYFEVDRPARVECIRARVASLHEHGLPVGPGEVRSQTLPGEDWAESWKRHFGVIQATERLRIVPTWETDAREDGDRILLDPGMAFGLGDHPTTRGCLRMLERIAERPARAADPGFPTADVGTGTGILAIRAVQLGLGPVEAFETDAEARRCARENAELNGVGDRVVVREGALPARGAGPYRLILANLFLEVLTSLMPRFRRSLRSEGELVAAGITLDQEDQLLEVAEARGLAAVDRICERAQPGARRWPILRLRTDVRTGQRLA